MTSSLKLEIAPDIHGVVDAQAAVADFAVSHDLSDRIAFALELATDEIVSNIVRHGFPPGQPDRRIACEAEVTKDAVAIAFLDNGVAFDPLTSAPEPDLTSPVAVRELGGLGVYLVKQLADETRYERTDDLNRLELAWRL